MSRNPTLAPTHRDRFQNPPGARTDARPIGRPPRLGPTLNGALGWGLALVLLASLGCGRDRTEAADTPEATTAAAEGSVPADAVATTEEPGDATLEEPVDHERTAPAADEDRAQSVDQADQAAQEEQEREALARKQRELDAREARLAQREAALRRSPATPKPADTAPAVPAPAETSSPASETATDAVDDDDWRRSTHRTDQAAREGYEPDPPLDREAGAGTEAGEDAWTDEAAPEPEPAVTWTSELLPSGTRLTVELLDTVASDRSQAGDTFRARVVEDVTRGGDVMIPTGSIVRGRVTEAVPLNPKVGGRARLGLEFFELEPPGAEPAPIDADFAAKGKSETAKDAATIGGAAAAGAILGRVLNRGDKGKGSVLGAIIGAAAGTVIASRTEGEEVSLPEGAQVDLVLTQPAQIPVREPVR